MSQMLDLIRKSEVPSNLMHSAARGSLSVPPSEMIEILVHLALHNQVFGEQARMTLAGWDPKACMAAASDPSTSREVLGYFIAQDNLRPLLLPLLAGNPAVEEQTLIELAAAGSRSVVDVLLSSSRVMNSPMLVRALQANSTVHSNELGELGKKLMVLEKAEPAPPSSDESDVPEATLEETVTTFLKENAAEVEAEKDKLFRPIGTIHEPLVTEVAAAAATSATSAATETPVAANAASATSEHPTPAASAVAGRVAPGTAAAAAAARAKKHAAPGSAERRESTLQKIAKLDIKGRIALAIRGGKEERSILVRDGTKIVALAVLESPKITDSEVEGFAQQKNVLESVLRQIPLKRRFAKNYIVIRNLVGNPRTPIDCSLGLVKHLMVHDLKNLTGNKEVSETIRKAALRIYKQKIEKKGH